MSYRTFKNICDCHFHVFGEEHRYPFAEHRSYTPAPASFDDYCASTSSIPIERYVFIQPSVYGTDNRCHLDALDARGHQARAVLVLDPDTPEATIAELHERGVRGIRLNLLFSGGPDRSMLTALATSLRRYDWHVQLLMDIATLPEQRAFLESLKLPLVFDHFGHFNPNTPEGNEGFELLCLLVEQQVAWVKLSAPYRFSLGGAPYGALENVTRALCAANPHQLLWGSDWPHPQAPETPASITRTLDLLSTWVADDEILHQILVTNPERLYDFPSTD